ncbi:hypothetical protein N7454_004996 [Penicillium verhagenii]|nr:hypothetical protein N7454_004996 [Penicillium verhagenii]
MPSNIRPIPESRIRKQRMHQHMKVPPFINPHKGILTRFLENRSPRTSPIRTSKRVRRRNTDPLRPITIKRTTTIPKNHLTTPIPIPMPKPRINMQRRRIRNISIPPLPIHPLKNHPKVHPAYQIQRPQDPNPALPIHPIARPTRELRRRTSLRQLAPNTPNMIKQIHLLARTPDHGGIMRKARRNDLLEGIRAFWAGAGLCTDNAAVRRPIVQAAVVGELGDEEVVEGVVVRVSGDAVAPG